MHTSTICGRVVFPGAAYVEMACAAIRAAHPAGVSLTVARGTRPLKVGTGKWVVGRHVGPSPPIPLVTKAHLHPFHCLHL